jgi:hypothetical protein
VGAGVWEEEEERVGAGAWEVGIWPELTWSSRAVRVGMRPFFAMQPVFIVRKNTLSCGKTFLCAF